MFLIAAWKEPELWAGELPIAAQNPQQLRREHDVTVLAAFALLNSDDLPVTVNVADLEKNDFRYAQAGGIDRRQRGTTLRLGIASRKRTTSSALRITGSFCGSRA